MNIKGVLLCSFMFVVNALATSAEINAKPLVPRGGERVLLSIPAPTAVGSYSWAATDGRFVSRTDSARVLYVAPQVGTATIVCLETVAGATRLRNHTLLIAQGRSGDPATRNEQPNAGTAPSSFDIGRGGFAPSGWMGDGENKGGFMTDVVDDHPPSGPPARRWVYRPKGAGWGAVAYQFPPGNWGDKPGRDLTGKGYQELSVWAKGLPDKNGRYPVVQFKAGGGSDPTKKYQASFESEGDFVTLKPDWVRYTVRLGKDLSSVISAFTFVIRADDNPHGATFLLSQLEYR